HLPSLLPISALLSHHSLLKPSAIRSAFVRLNSKIYTGPVCREFSIGFLTASLPKLFQILSSISISAMASQPLHQYLKLSTSDSNYVFFPPQAFGVSEKALCISRENSQLSLKDQSAFKSYSERYVSGILGIIKLQSNKYIIVITKEREIGKLGQHKVWKLEEWDIIPVFKRANSPEDEICLNLLKSHLGSAPLYFSRTLDVTNTLQRQVTTPYPDHALWQRADTRFFWNRYLQSELVNFRKTSGAELDKYILPVMYGNFEIADIRLKGQPFTLVLVSRRSRFRAGTRYFSRGLDAAGNASNFNETEQIVLCETPTEGFVQLSYVQTRGSVPTQWNEIVHLKYHPRLRIHQSEDSIQAARNHFESQLSLYGDQYLVNLVNQKGREADVKRAYEDMIDELKNLRLHYTYFDFHHECSKMRWHRVQILIDQLEPNLVQQGYCHVGKEIKKMQTSVVRSNCMDCLDRTNVVQSSLARWVLTRQLRDIGLLNSNETFSDSPQFESVFRNMWADNADVVSRAYSGTGALKTDFTRTGLRTKAGAFQDFQHSVMRYLRNNFIDGGRQDAYDLFLGNFSPDEMPIPVFQTKSLFLQSIPYILFTSIVMLLAGLILPRDDDARLPLRYFFMLWFAIFLWSAKTLIVNGLEYVNWPTLVVPDWIDAEKTTNIQRNPKNTLSEIELGRGKKRLE
ncbi:hypothetical protein NEOLI_004568, partial [Neolecta irregularis DAH-3]